MLATGKNELKNSGWIKQSTKSVSMSNPRKYYKRKVRYLLQQIGEILEGEIFCKVGARQVSETMEIGCSRAVDPGIMR